MRDEIKEYDAVAKAAESLSRVLLKVIANMQRPCLPMMPCCLAF